MKDLEKAKLLHDRHIKFTIEWGGTDLFTNCSDMSVDGMEEFIKILRIKDKDKFNQELTDLIQREYDREQD